MPSLIRYHQQIRLILTRRPTTRSYSSSSLLCSSCRAPLPTRLPACPNCFHIERPVNKYDYYELLETPKSPNPFIINENRLKDNFRRMQRYVHPDLWAAQGEDKTLAAHHLSGLVNEAYNTLLRPLSRIHYILSQHNVGISETDQSNDPQLITEIIEIREALESASSEGEVEEIKHDVTGKVSVTTKNIEEAVHLENWEKARREAVRLKYLRGLEAAAQSWPNPPPGDH
ncbi:Co-chaperone Hsc20 [Lactifluus volemus]|nr:Co-chaperone Hsc20 [Lactifluus volemus]